MWRSLKTLLLDFLFPIHCVGCKKAKTHCCERCLGAIPLLREKSVLQITPGKFAFSQVISAARFHESSPVAQLIHRFKYDGAQEISDVLVRLVDVGLPRNAILVPVPLHKRRQNFRGFNQSELLAKELGIKYGLPMQKILKRQKYTRPQVELSFADRQTNLRGAFSMADEGQKLDANADYFVVDDVFTTGATINECAKILKLHGAQRVSGLTIARTG